MRDALVAFLDSLDDGQRTRATFAFDDAERTTWFYTPTDHGGIPIGELTPLQQQRAFALLATALSPAAYATVCSIISLENELDRVEGFATWGRYRREGRPRDPGLYYVAVFGDVGIGAWGWRVGGHHVSVQRTFVDGALVSFTPSFLGANPADTRLVGGAWLRPLQVYEDLARELVHAHRDAVATEDAPQDLASGNRPFLSVGDAPMATDSLFREGDAGAPPSVDAAVPLTREPHGVTSPDFQPLVDAYCEQVPGLEIDASGMRFLWAGGIEKGEPHYYRLQDDQWLIEYDNVQNAANHIHTVVRSWDGDFGRDALSAHHRAHH